MKILVVENDASLRQTLVLALELIYGADTTSSATAAAALEAVQKDPNFQFILCDLELDPGSGLDVLDAIRAQGMNTPFILSTAHRLEDASPYQPSEINFYIQKPYVFEDLRKIIDAILEKSNAREAIPSYIRVSSAAVSRMNPAICDLFLKTSDTSFVIAVNAGDLFSTDVLSHHSGGAVDSVYIHREDAPILLQRAAQGVLELFSRDEEEPTFDEAYNAELAAHELIHEAVTQLGLSEESKALARATAELALKTISRSPALSALLAKLRIEQDKYINSHSVALAHLSCGIASVMGWMSEPTFLKLALAAFLHDITLENHALAQVQRLDALAAPDAKWTKAEVANYPKHPTLAAELSRQLPTMPPDLDHILAQHHERPDGSGFPIGQDHTRISPLSSVFIVSHDLLTYQMKHPGPDSVTKFLDAYSTEYNLGTFKKVHAALRAQISTGTAAH